MTWYHGSQLELTELREGSSITENVHIARAFSHRPKLVQMDDDEDVESIGSVKHNGTTPGYLYVVDDELEPDDLRPHPHPVNVSRWEWLVNRPVAVRLIERTEPRPEAMLTAEELARIERLQSDQGLTPGESFAVETPDHPR